MVMSHDSIITQTNDVYSVVKQTRDKNIGFKWLFGWPSSF